MSTPPGLYSGDRPNTEPPPVVAVPLLSTESGLPSLTLRQLRQLTRLLLPLAQEWTVSGRLERLVEAASLAVGAAYVAFGRLGWAGTYGSFLFSPVDRQGLAEMQAILTAQGVGGHDDPTQLSAAEGTLESLAGDVEPVAFIVAPLETSRGRIGNLFVMSMAGAPPFTLLDRQLILSLVEIAAAGMENIDEYEETRQRQQWLQAAGEVSHQLVGSDHDELDLWQIIATHIHRLAGARTVTISTPVPGDPSTISVLVAVGAGAADLVGQRYPMGGSIAELALSENRGQVGRPDLFCVHSRVLVSAGISEPLGEVMAVPLVSSDDSRGAIIVSRRPDDPTFSTADLSMAQTFASQAVLALERAEAHRIQQQLRLLEDRERIARDLHDHVIQALFATGLNLNAALHTPSPADLTRRIATSIDSIDDTMRQIRATIFDLQTRPSSDTTARQVTDQVLSNLQPLQLPLHVQLTGPLDQPLPDRVAADLAAVLREALTNAHKHAHPTRVTLTITAEIDQITVDVIDDGPGLDISQRRSGLANLRSRAARAGGTFTLQPATPHGLHLHWTTPQPTAPRAALA